MRRNRINLSTSNVEQDRIQINHKIRIYQMLKEEHLIFEIMNKENQFKKSGCYAVNPDLLQQRPNQRILVPLRSSEYHVEIANSIANITLTQTYLNPTDKFLEVEYSFPINPDACVYRFVAEFNKTRIEGVVKEKEQAKQEYQQAIKEGKKAAYGELNADSKDILNLKVGNVPPKETVRIEIVYLQELTLACNTFYQLHMVGTISPRYMNYIPAEQIKAGLRSEAARAQRDFYWNFTISLRTSRKVVFFKSNSHLIQLISQTDQRTELQIRMSSSCIPSKDFFFLYTTENFQLPSYIFGKTDQSSSAILSFIPKFSCLSLEDAYKYWISMNDFESDLNSSKGQYIFFIDRSASMDRNRIQKAKQALILFLKSLPIDAYFNIISFGSGYEQMLTKSKYINDQEINLALIKIKQMQANMGGTEIYNPLEKILTEKYIQGYPKHIFLLTDGSVTSKERIINLVANNNKYSRVHTIGIGNKCSQQFIVECAQKGKGHHVLISDQQNPSEKIIQLLTDSLSPVISNMKLTYDKEIVESIIPNPQSMPYVLKGELVNFYITFKGQLDTIATFSFTYEDSLNKLSFQSQVIIDPSNPSQPFIDRMGHFRRIRLLQEHQLFNFNLQDHMFSVKAMSTKADIIKQSVKHQILSVHTTLLCVEKVLIEGKYEQMKDKVSLNLTYQNSFSFDQSPKSRESLLESQQLENIQRLIIQIHQIKLQANKCKSQPEKNEKINLHHIKLKKAVSFEIPNKRTNCGWSTLCSEKQASAATSPPIRSKPILKQTAQSDKAFINELICCQSVDGSWKQLSLIKKVLGKNIEKQILKQNDSPSVITYLIVKWIQKHHPNKEYSLVIKKGLNFVSHHIQQVQTFQKRLDKYLI